ncbi:LOW QUALITY PROTEIN: Hypothetical protein PHPALM_36789 [Phytophthora palmivora]|uniref:Uncharacterized protein n=1 Tax=Phytophthora palmivora TaxID=4796 RepID=A0A2P4WZ17_9STRA|nr:LOW QUALITY PROTEIN: Hypothetical protein PHPALM_36789 [Phytophthora palmivora]
MVRDRFMRISSNLHFSSNEDERARTDKAWKQQPVCDALAQRFQRGYILPAMKAYVTIPIKLQPYKSLSKRYAPQMGDKALYALLLIYCILHSRAPPRAYIFLAPMFAIVCLRANFLVMLYTQQGDVDVVPDVRSGLAAVVRNLREVSGRLVLELALRDSLAPIIITPRCLWQCKC